MINNKLAICSALLILSSCTLVDKTLQMKYPESKKSNHTDVYFGEKVNDPYRAFEDDRSEQTKNWVKEQNLTTYSYLDKIPFRNQIKDELNNIWNYEKISAPFKEGNYTYYYKNNGLLAQSILYRKSQDNIQTEFLNPNTFSKDGTTSLADISFNDKGDLLAYSISEGGSDWRKILIINAETKEKIDEGVENAKFSGISWLKDEGFYYSTYDKPKEASILSGKTDKHKVYFHKLGTKQSEDKLIIGGEDFPRRYMSVSVSKNQKYLILSASNSTNGNELYYKEVDSNSKFKPIITGFDFNTNLVDIDDNYFYFFTDKNAPNKQLVKVPISNPQTENWQVVIPESKNVMEISKAGNYFFATYMIDAIDVVKQFDYSGKFVREIKLPGKGNVSGFNAKKKDKTLYFSFTNYITPSNIYELDIETGYSKIYEKPKVKFNSDNFVSEQVFYTSKDGTKIPMIINYKKGTKLNGKNPTILYSYGGFNISLQPSFSVVNAVWMENGGIYAVPNIRGGGEYGKLWHDAGTKMQKKNVFDDFIAAAEFLHNNNYTSPKYTALSGRSNGGLLVGAAMTIRPDIAKVALPGVGVLDMLRYHTFTAGAGWAYDYGTANDSKEMFEYLKSYSPVHNVKANTCYPSTLIITSDHDDRVVPAHSFKFAAELQAKQACKNPNLVRIEVNAGHGAGRSTQQIINENTDLISFAMFEMGIKTLK